MSQLKLLNELLAAGVISENEKEEIVKKQWNKGERIEDILVNDGYVTEEELLSFISDRYKMPVVSLKDVKIDEEATYHVPSRLSRKFIFIPIRRIDRDLIIAFSEPLDEDIIQELRAVTDLNIVPLLARKSEIENAIREIYSENKGNGGGIKPSTPVQNIPTREFPGRFEDFIAGPCNEKAFKLANAFLNSEIYNLLIIGETGSGKTFLLGAINRALRDQGKKTAIFSIPDFENVYIKAKNSFGIAELRDFILSSDVLIFDEIEYVQNRPYLQEEVAYLMEKFMQSGKQILAATLIEPGELKAVSKKFISLLKSLIDVRLEEIDKETAIKYLNSDRFNLSPHDVEAILKENPRTFRDLEGIAQKILAIKKFLSSSL